MMSKEELESAIKVANVWAGRATLVLAIGILGEYVLLPFLETRKWFKPAKILFAVLVVAGIVGEYEFSSLIAQHAEELQRISDRELKNATTLAGDVSDRAYKLAVLLAEEERSTRKFQEQARESERRLAKAPADLAGAQKGLDFEIRRRSSRATLLRSTGIKSDLRLQSLAKQKVRLVSCFPPSEVTNNPVRMFTPSVLAVMGLGDDPITLERNETLDELGRQLFAADWSPAPSALPCTGTGIRMQLDPSPIAKHD